MGLIQLLKVCGQILLIVINFHAEETGRNASLIGHAQPRRERLIERSA